MTSSSDSHPTTDQKVPKVQMKPWDECSREERIERWENVVRVLEALTPHEREKHFDMNDWGSKNDCGTVACAAGHCGLDPWFNARGFYLTFKLVEEDEENDAFWDSDISDPEEFFGKDGCDSVFYSGWFTFDKALDAVKEHLEVLKS